MVENKASSFLTRVRFHLEETGSNNNFFQVIWSDIDTKPKAQQNPPSKLKRNSQGRPVGQRLKHDG